MSRFQPEIDFFEISGVRGAIEEMSRGVSANSAFRTGWRDCPADSREV